LAGFGACLIWRWGGAEVTRWVDDLGLLVLAALAAAACCRAAARQQGRERSAWLLLGVGLAGWTAGALVWCYYELWQGDAAPFPSPADAGYLLFPIAACCALATFPSSLAGQSRTRLALDGLLVAGSLFILSWLLVLGDLVTAEHDSALVLAVSLAYPLTDVTVLSMVVVLAAHARTQAQITLALLGAGMALMALSDSAFVYLSQTDAYASGDLIDIGWAMAFATFAIAAHGNPSAEVHAGPAVSATHADGSGHVPPAPEPGRLRVWFPYLPLILAGAVALPRTAPYLTANPPLLAGLLTVLVLLARQLVTLVDNQQLLRRTAHQALHDPLTGLANRALFHDRLGHALQQQRRDPGPVTLLCLDLDDFKSVNDTWGHLAGDELLVHTAERLSGCLRAGDTLARLGGDEFAILAHDHTHPIDPAGPQIDPGSTLIARVREAFLPPVLVRGRRIQLRPSIGVASTVGGEIRSADDLLHAADLAMYRDKQASRTNRMLHQQ
jgi:diguanylate cyclase